MTFKGYGSVNRHQFTHEERTKVHPSQRKKPAEQKKARVLFTDELKEEYLEYLAQGFSSYAAARKVGVSERLPEAHGRKNPEFGKRRQEAREKGHEALMEAANNVDYLIIKQTEQLLEGNYSEGKLNDKANFKDLQLASSISHKQKGLSEITINNMNAQQTNIDLDELIKEVKAELGES